MLRRKIGRRNRIAPGQPTVNFIRKRLERLKLISPGQFDGAQFKKLEEQLYGMPFHRRS